MLGSDKNSYNVFLDTEYPRKSKCNCPLANGKKIICKHIVATYFKAIPGSAIEFEKTYIGVQPFIKKLIPMKTDAAVIKEIDES